MDDLIESLCVGVERAATQIQGEFTQRQDIPPGIPVNTETHTITIRNHLEELVTIKCSGGTYYALQTSHK